MPKNIQWDWGVIGWVLFFFGPVQLMRFFHFAVCSCNSFALLLHCMPFDHSAVDDYFSFVYWVFGFCGALPGLTCAAAFVPGLELLDVGVCVCSTLVDTANGLQSDVSNYTGISNV